MVLKEFYKRFQLDESIVRETGFNPYYCQIEPALGDPIIVQGKEFSNRSG